MRSKLLWVALALVAVLGLTATASGTVLNMITGKQIAPHSITSLHMVNGTLQAHDMSPAFLKSLQGKVGATGPQGSKGDTGAKGETGAKGDTGPQGPPGVSGLEADGPYPSLTQLSTYADAGANSTAAWANDGTLQTSWVMCASGKTALGGGFGQDDIQSDKLIIVTSAPAFITDAGVVDPANTPTAGAEGSIVPNGWLVQGYNESATSLVVRPWVICADDNK